MRVKDIYLLPQSGVRFATTDEDRNDVILSNQISLLLSLLPLIYISTNVYNLGWSRITIPILLQPIIFLIPILINYLGAIIISRVFLCWVMALQALTFSIYNKTHGLDFQTSHYIGIQFSILASSVIPFLVFRLKNIFLITLSLSSSLLSIVFFDSIHHFFGVGYGQVGLHETGYSLTTMRVINGFLLITGSSLFLKRQVEKKEIANKELILNLSEKNSEILLQLEEISSQNDYISSQKDQLQNQKEIIEKQNNSLLKAKEDLEWRVEEKSKDILTANVELEKQNMQLEQFAFMAAHNLRSPVARIKGLCEILDIPMTSAVEKENIIRLVKKSSNDLDEVIHDLVAVVQIRAERDGNRSTLVMANILNKVLQHLHHEIEANQVEIINEIDPQLQFEAHEAFVYSVFLNIISNSIKYRNNIMPVVRIVAEQTDKKCVVKISDNGIGFDSSANKEKLFKPFSRLNTILPGKGLGLYMVKMQMENMGGQVFIHSEPNKGTSMVLHFEAA